MAERSTVWLKVLLIAGALLAVALLVQTGLNYRYVSNSLILQDARRVAEERVRNVERAARLTRPQDAEAFRALLDDVRAESDQVAGIALVQGTGVVFNDFDVGGVTWGLTRALSLYPQKALWRRLVQNAMAQDFSWRRQVAEYVSLYETLVRN